MKVKFGRKVVDVYHENFEYYQPNSHIDGDCVIRAICKATGLSWRDAYKKAFEESYKHDVVFNWKSGERYVMESLGFKWIPIKPEKGSKRPLVHEFAREHTETCVMAVAGHFVTCKDGKYYDIWDSGDKSLYGYYTKK